MFTRFAHSEHGGIVCLDSVLLYPLAERTIVIECKSVNDSHSYPTAMRIHLVFVEFESNTRAILLMESENFLTIRFETAFFAH